MLASRRRHSRPLVGGKLSLVPLLAALCIACLFLLVLFRASIGSSTLFSAFVLVTLTVPLIQILPVRYVVLLPFCSVMWLGEAFHFSERFPFSPTGPLTLLVLAACLIRNRPDELFKLFGRDRLFTVLSILFTMAVLLGVVSMADRDVIRADAVPFLYFLCVYVVGRLQFRRQAELRTVIHGLIVVTCLAIVKILYIYSTRARPSWEGELQALAIPGLSPLDTRIILHGADVFFFLCGTFILGALLATPGLLKKTITLVPLVIVGIGMFFSATRTNWVGLAFGVAAQLFFVLRHGLPAQRRLVSVLLAFTLVSGVAGLIGRESQYSVGEKLRERFESPQREVSLDVRISEARALLKSMGANFLLGRGMGSEFVYVDWGQGGYVRANWSHNSFLFLYLKMGLIGLLVYSFLVVDGLKRLWRLAMATKDSTDLALYLGLLGALVCLCVLSLGVNKNFAASGALFSGLFLGAIRNLHTGEPQNPGPRQLTRVTASTPALGASPPSQ